MWLNEFKKAIILHEFETIETLLSNTPSFTTLAEMEEASYLILNAITLLKTERSTVLQSLNQLKNTIDFLRSTENSKPSSLNLKL